MSDLSSATKPTVSIILPTYNRAKYLPAAFESIRSQIFTDWELIIVDDGSSDETREMVPVWTQGIKQPVRYLYHENRGAYGARNTGLDHATGKYIAFYDSDDIWLPHHLLDCVVGLDANPDVDWVYGACRIVDDTSDHVLSESTFYVDGQPRPFLRLRSRNVGRLNIIEDPSVIECMVAFGGYNGLQNSVIRSEAFDHFRFEAVSRNEAEDQLLVIRSLRRGVRMAYIDSVHVIYKVHESNSSAVAGSQDLERQARVLRLLADGYEQVLLEESWAPSQRTALRKRLQQEYFWKLGYATLWSLGRKTEAIQMFRRGLQHWPWDWKCWKTYTLALARRFVTPSDGDSVARHEVKV